MHIKPKSSHCWGTENCGFPEIPAQITLLLPGNLPFKFVLGFLLHAACFQSGSRKCQRSTHSFSQNSNTFWVLFIYCSQGCSGGRKNAKPSTRSKISILFRTLGSEVYHSYSDTQYRGKAVLRSLSSLKAPSPPPTPKTYCIFSRATSIRPTPLPPLFWYKLCKTFLC